MGKEWKKGARASGAQSYMKEAILKRDPFRTLKGMSFHYPTGKYRVRSSLPVEGFDTETQNGYAKILSDSNSWIEVHGIEDVLEFLTRKHLRDRCNVFFNMRFDFEVMMKHSRELLEMLAENPKKVEFEDYTIDYIKSKTFGIKKDKHVVRYYDISQFYNSSLEYASQKYLGQSCHELKGDRAHLFDLHPVEKIGEYCQDDANKARQLGEYIIEKFKEIGVVPRRLYSCGYVAQLYTVNHADIPSFFDIPAKVQSMYWKSYRGGWFDTYKRGIIKLSSYDLKSAYPWALSQIPDPLGGKWHVWKEGLNISQYPVGVFKCAIRGEMDGNPCSVSLGGKSIYPRFDKYLLVYLTLSELLQLKDVYHIRILDGYYLDTDNGIRPYEPLVRRLFDIKEGSKGDVGLYDTVKKIINSLYGKTAQVNRDGKATAGRLFNPYFASECTSRCRVRIHEAIKDQLDKVVSIMTDGIFMEGGHRLKEGKLLGDFEEKFSNTNTLVIETGVYEPESHGVKTRGFTRKQIRYDETGTPFVNKNDFISLFDLLNTRSSRIKVYQFRPRHFQECFVQGCLDRVGVFEAVEKELDLNADLKRIWECNVRGKDLLENEYGSCAVPGSLFIKSRR
jgi:hypothetical protein